MHAMRDVNAGDVVKNGVMQEQEAALAVLRKAAVQS